MEEIYTINAVYTHLLEKHMFIKAHKNALFTTIQRHNFQPEQFDMIEEYWTYNRKTSVFTLTFRGTELYFEVKDYKDKHINFWCNFKRFNRNTYEISDDFYPKGNGLLRSYGFDTIDGIVSRFVKWLNDDLNPYDYENKMPDLWAQLEEYRKIAPSNTIFEQETDYFTEPQKTQIRSGIQQFRFLIVDNYNPSREQLHLIDSRLKYLTDGVDRLNRFDWKGMAFNIVFSIATALSLDHTQGQMLFQLLEQALHAAYKMLP